MKLFCHRDHRGEQTSERTADRQAAALLPYCSTALFLFFFNAAPLAAADTPAAPDSARVIAQLRERGDFRQAEAYGIEQWNRKDLPESERVSLTIQLAILFTEQALAAPPEEREAHWTKAEGTCSTFLLGWPESPRRVLVEVQRALIALKRGEQARQSNDIAGAVAQLRGANHRLRDITDAVVRELIELRLRRPGNRPAEALTIDELESLENHIHLQLARGQLQFGLCHPAGSPDRDDALLQAVKRLAPLAERTPPDQLTWDARLELASAWSALGRDESAKQMINNWLRENPPADVRKRFVAETATRMLQAVPKPDRARAADSFSSAMRSAASEHQAGRYAAAAERYRRLAQSDPNHPRASEAHRLAVLSLADLVRESPPAEQETAVASYEALLREHLAQWPNQSSSDEVRLWLARLLVTLDDTAAAAELLQQVSATSDYYRDSVQLRIHCYERQLQQLARRDSDVTARSQILAAATRDLQPVITGPDNRWPDAWTSLERDAALALARLHIRFSDAPSPYAERLLRAALRGNSSPPDIGKENAWISRASLMLIEALAQNDKAAEARAVVDQLSDRPVDALLDTLSALDTLLAGNATEPDEKRELGELSLSLIALADSRSSELDSASRARLDQWRASALATAGDRSAALAHYAALAAASPDDGRIQERYAALLEGSNSPPELRDALARWKQVESRSRRGGPRWRRARSARIDLLTRLGEPAEADKLLRLTRLLYPDWDSSAPSP